jgi:hypothetical protein
MLCTLGLSIGLLSSSGIARAADAASPVAWTQSLQGGNQVDLDSAILTDPDGDVTVGGCSSYSPQEAIETWTSGHTLVGSRPITASPNPQLCSGDGLTDAQGNTYSLLLNQAADIYDIMAFKPNGTNLWPTPMPLPTTCVGNPDSLGYSQPVLGADGNIYGLVYYGQVNACPTAIELYGINHTTGALLFADTLNPDAATFASDVSAYADGLVVRSDNQVTYYSYGGDVIGGPYAMTGQQIDREEGVAATTSGQAFAAVGQTTTPTSSCPLQFTLDAIEAFQPNGFLWKTAITGCNAAVSVNAMPDGGVAVLIQNYTTGGADNSYILRFSNTGGRLPWSLAAGDLYVDINGNIVTESEYHLDDPSDPVINNEPEVRVDVYNGVTGTEIYDFDTANLNSGNSYDEGINAIGLDQGRIYLGISECTGNIYPTGEACGSPAKLWAINAPGVGIDYPRGAMLGATSNSPNDLRRCPVVSPDGTVDQFDTALVNSSPDPAFDGVSAEIGQAPVCVDTGTAKSTQWADGAASSWVMLESKSDLAQAGILYHPDGLGSQDTMFVAIQTPTFTVPARNLIDKGARFGPIEVIAKKADHYLEVNFGTAVSSGTFSVSVGGPVTTDEQCSGEPSDNTRGYANVQGANPSKANPEDVVELTYGSQCLWDFFLAPSIASDLDVAEIAAETHSSGSHFPGTVVQPLEFSDVTTTIGNVTGWFANPSATAPPSTGCHGYVGTESSYIFVVWSKDQGSCD